MILTWHFYATVAALIALTPARMDGMNGEGATAQLKRIEQMVRYGSACTIETVPGELDSVHLTFHCGVERYSVQWTGAWLATLTDDDLWRLLDIQTRGRIKKPAESN